LVGKNSFSQTVLGKSWYSSSCSCGRALYKTLQNKTALHTSAVRNALHVTRVAVQENERSVFFTPLNPHLLLSSTAAISKHIARVAVQENERSGFLIAAVQKSERCGFGSWRLGLRDFVSG